MASVGISDDGAEIVDGGRASEFRVAQVAARFALLAVVEELGHEEVLDFVRNGVGRIVGKIGAWLIRARASAGGLPPGDVDSLEVLGHLGDLHGIKAARHMISG